MTIPTAPIYGPTYWTPHDLDQSQDWHYTLTASDASEIKQAVEHIRNNNIDYLNINPGSFELPELGKKFKQIDHELNNGWGLFQLHGLPTAELDEMDNMRMALGVSSYFGKFRGQNKQNWVVSHIRDFGIDPSLPISLPSRTNQGTNMHCDSSDITTLTCLGVSKSGGESAVANAQQIHNHMLEHHPDLHRELFSLIPYDRKNEIGPGQDPWFMMAICSWYQQQLTTSFNIQYVESCQQLMPQAPRLTSTQWDAVRMYDILTRDPKFCYKYHFQPGDLQLLCNHVMVHGRSTFQNDADHVRHLLRIWVSPEHGRSLPEYFIPRWGSNMPGARGGVKVNDAPYVVKTFEAACIEAFKYQAEYRPE